MICEAIGDSGGGNHQLFLRKEGVHDTSRTVYEEGLATIESLRKFLSFLDEKTNRPTAMNKFMYYRLNQDKMISDLKYWLEGTLPSREIVDTKAIEIFGHNVVKDDETTEDKLNDSIESLRDAEQEVWELVREPMDYELYNTGDEDDAIPAIDDWLDIFERIRKLHSYIKAQIAKNPEKFKPRSTDEPLSGY